MRKMLLGIYLALMGIASLLASVGLSAIGLILALVFFTVSAYCVLDGYFSWGPKAREDGEETGPDLPPQYK